MTALFTNFDPDFASFLVRSAASTEGGHWPIARNFLLDERISPARAECYRDHGAISDHGSVEEWERSHGTYLRKKISVRGDDFDPPESIDAEDLDICPDTFRFPVFSSSLVGALSSDLIRVQKVSSFRDRSKKRPEDVVKLAEDALANDRNASQRLDKLLQWFVQKRDRRPVFAGVWEDLSDLFGETPMQDLSGWADNLRDRLGLYTYDPKQSDAINILVFRYPVEIVPRLSGVDGKMRPLTVPCVLDGDLSQAFCPAPRESDTGYTMDLAGARSCDRLTREVLHPAMRLRTKHLFRVGTITRPVDPEAIREQRGLHLTCLREHLGRPEYGKHTDEDLLQ